MDKKVQKVHVNVIGAGFAGIECALFLAKHGVRVHLFNCASQMNKCESACCCHINQLSPDDGQVREHLRKEIKAFGSELIDEETRLKKENSGKDISDKIIEFGLKKVKNNPNIDYFDICVHEINLKEINVVASGHSTEGRLFEWLQDEFGSLKCYSTYPVYPLVQEVDTEKIKSKTDNTNAFFIPFNYEEYIALCNKVIKERNQYIDYLKKRGQDPSCIEDIVLKNKDALKSTIMKPIFLEGQEERPYATLKILNFKDKYQIQGFCSNLPIEAQERIIKSIKAFKNVVILRAGEPIKNCYLNAPLVINEFWQSKRRENLFFAGNLAGIFGHIEGMASGLIVGHNVLRYLQGRKMSTLPKSTCLGLLSEKLISQNSINFTPISANYGIIEEEDNKTLFENSISLITKYEEDYNGRNV